MSIEQVALFRKRAASERDRAERFPEGPRRAKALALAIQYDQVADAYQKLVNLGGSMFS